jgi:hypothetical protein
MPPCEVCGRLNTALTRHHLLPQSRHSKPRFSRHYTKQEGLTRIALLCKACHSFVHSVLSEKELAERYNTLELLLGHPEIAKFAQWIAPKPPGYQPLSRKYRDR